ncbi:MAG: hypothetical protein EXS58_08300 [Candidatus Latescibacteria bacterium]|nr:hypothetical protein [Candidatus Latescibacterota bacterium]
MCRAIKAGLLLLATQLCLSGAAQAQLSRAWAEKESGKWYFQLGAGQMDTGELNTILGKAGYSVLTRSPLNDMSNSYISFGLGTHGVINGVLIGWELNGLTSRETTNAASTYRVTLGGGYGFVNVGYLAYSMEGLDIYPMIGIGGGGVHLRMASRRTLSFPQVVASPDQAVDLNTGGFLLNPSLGLDYMLSLSGDEKRENGVIFGLRLGYVLSPLTGAWKVDQTDVAGGPQASVAGPYVRLTVGLGSRKSY